MSTPADDTTIQEDLQQPVGDDTCGECAAVYVACKDGWIDFTRNPEDLLTYVAMVRQDLGMDPTQGGTTLLGEFQACQALAKRLNCAVDLQPITGTPDVNPAFHLGDYPGYCAIVGMDLGAFLPQLAGADHFVVFDAQTGRAWHALDSCHDIDASLGVPSEWYDLATILKAGQALFGEGQQIGWLVKFYPTGEDPMSSPANPNPDATPTQRQLFQQNALIADALYDVVKALSFGTGPQGTFDAATLQDAKTKVNALNPDKFIFQ